MHRAHDPHRVLRRVQEVGIAERDVLGSGGDELRRCRRAPQPRRRRARGRRRRPAPGSGGNGARTRGSPRPNRRRAARRRSPSARTGRAAGGAARGRAACSCGDRDGRARAVPACRPGRPRPRPRVRPRTRPRSRRRRRRRTSRRRARSNRSACRWPCASSRASRVAVCIGTENATRSAQSTSAGSHGSSDVSSARTSCPSARSRGRGRGEVPRLVTELVGRDEEDTHDRPRLRWFCDWGTSVRSTHERARRVVRGAAQDRSAAHQGRVAPGGRVLGRGPRLRDRGPLPAHGLPAAPGHGRVRSRHLSLAPRPLRPRERLHARPVRRRRARLRRHDRRRRRARRRRATPAIRSRTCAAGSSRASKTASRSSSPSRCSGCSRPAWRRPTSCASGSTSARATATAAGARGSPCSSRWPTSCRTSTRPTARSRSRTGSSSSSRDTSNQPPRFGLDPLDDGVDPDRLGEWYRRFVETRSSDAAERSLDHRDRVRCRADDVEG